MSVLSSASCCAHDVGLDDRHAVREVVAVNVVAGEGYQMRIALDEHDASIRIARGDAKSDDADTGASIKYRPGGGRFRSDRSRQQHGVRAGPIAVPGLPDAQSAAKEQIIRRRFCGNAFRFNGVHVLSPTRRGRRPSGHGWLGAKHPPAQPHVAEMPRLTLPSD